MQCIRQRRNRRGVILVLAALFLAATAMALSMALETSQKFLEWKMLRTRAEAAALAAVAEFDGGDDALKRAEARAAEAAKLPTSSISIDADPERGRVIVRLRTGVAVAAAAHQVLVADPAATGEGLRMAAPESDHRGYGLSRDAIYTATGEAEIGKVVPVQVHSGFPKEIPLTWIAGRVESSSGGRSQIRALGGYLRGARTGAAALDGWYEIRLGPAEVSK